ncbi:MAG TPA: Gfo/Idh/MocA family oxidoreductase, partial [Flavobacteriales bacterium]|nr:Gfo/Idh/MocA family oxidoreductase [Flavobacteriales bacterium]
MTADHKVKFAIVGYGHIGKRHAEMVTAHTETELVAVTDILTKAELGAIAHDVPFHTDMVEMLAAHPGIDVVIICTPNGLHAEQCILALEHRMHVVCEKPLALSKAACEAVIYKALQVHRTVFGVMQNRYSPPSQWIKGVLDKDLLGAIHMVQVNCYW